MLILVGGTTEASIISLGGIVVSNSIRTAGDEIDKAIISYVKKEYNVAIGNKIAEEIKINLGTAIKLEEQKTMKLTGRDLSVGLPRNIIITTNQVYNAIKEEFDKIIEVIKITLEKTPPELISDIMKSGIILTGGGALINNLDKLIEKEIGITVNISEEPLNCVVNGTEKTLENIKSLKRVLGNNRKK